MTLTIFPWKFTNKVLQCFGQRFYKFQFVELKPNTEKQTARWPQ